MRFNEHNRFALCKWTKIQNLTRVLIPTQKFMLFFFHLNLTSSCVQHICFVCIVKTCDHTIIRSALWLSLALFAHMISFSPQCSMYWWAFCKKLSLFLSREQFTNTCKHLRSLKYSQSLSFALLIVLDSVIVSIVIHVRKFELSSYSKFIYNFSLKHQLIHSYNQS